MKTDEFIEEVPGSGKKVWVEKSFSRCKSRPFLNCYVPVINVYTQENPKHNCTPSSQVQIGLDLSYLCKLPGEPQNKLS